MLKYPKGSSWFSGRAFCVAGVFCNVGIRGKGEQQDRSPEHRQDTAGECHKTLEPG